MSSGRVLIVDDEPGMRGYLQTALEVESFQVEAVASGEEAVGNIQKNPADVVLLDMVLPGWDGLETLRHIRRISPFTRVVMISCVRDTRKVAQAMRLGAQDYLSKPIQEEELYEIVRFCLQHTAPNPTGRADVVDVDKGVLFFSATPQMQTLRSQAMQVARFDFPVLLLGESGTGKEVLAHLIHKYSERSSRVFLKVNCAAVPSELLESELFGYEPGAFTGATKSKPGKFELCNGGTLLLDEIGEMSPALQAKLLQVLSQGTTRRLFIIAIVFVIVATVSAFADPVEMRFAGLGGENQNGEYTYPYFLTIENGPQFPAICDDFYHESNVGDTWQANLTPLSGGDLSKTRFGILSEYQEAGYLLMQMRDDDQPEWGNINFAIWKIFNPSVDMGPHASRYTGTAILVQPGADSGFVEGRLFHRYDRDSARRAERLGRSGIPLSHT